MTKSNDWKDCTDASMRPPHPFDTLTAITTEDLLIRYTWGWEDIKYVINTINN